MSYNDLRKGRISEPGREYFVTMVVNGRRRVFDDFRCARIFISEIGNLENNCEMIWQAWVVMPDHFHGLLSLTKDAILSETIQKLKGRSSRTLNKYLQRTGTTFWQPGFHDHALRKEEDRKEIARYIIGNPVRNGIVQNVMDYPHWDAIWL